MMDITVRAAQLDIASVLLRLLLAVSMGGVIGLEREVKGRPAGFRTYMFVALGATVAMLLNEYLDFMQTHSWAVSAALGSRTDVSRLGAQIINGVGFLGAGTILMTSRQEIMGITTAAGLWASACLGLAIGAGFYDCAFAGVLFILICMGVFSRMENRIMSNSRNMNLYIEVDEMADISSVTAGLKAMGIKIYNVDITKTGSPSTRVGAVFSIYLPARGSHELALIGFSSLPPIRLINEV